MGQPFELENGKLLPATRTLLVGFAVLTVLAFVPLFLLGDQTDRTFACTINVPATARFLGARFLSGTVLVVLALQSGSWATLFAGLTLTTIPLVILFLLATRQIVSGLTAGMNK